MQVKSQLASVVASQSRLRRANAVGQIPRAPSHRARASIKSIHLQVSTWPPGALACQSSLAAFTLCQRLWGPTVLCRLIPAQGATSSTELKPGGASRSAAGRSKNKTLAFPVGCRGRWGVSEPAEKAEDAAPTRGRETLLPGGGCWVYLFI